MLKRLYLKNLSVRYLSELIHIAQPRKGKLEMPPECIHPFDAESLKLFALKGAPAACDPSTLTFNRNGLKVRRVMQIIRDLAKSPFNKLRILDLACGEGVYAIEAAMRGAEVVAFDARSDRMSEGAKAAKRLGLSNLRFEQTDIRAVNIVSHGRADVILLLGILYHLDDHDVFPVLQNVFEMCGQFVIIDTHIALSSQQQVEHNGQSYYGEPYREHADNDPAAVRRGRLLSSLDNTWSFWFTRESLFRLLKDVDSTTVFQCEVPFEPFKPQSRITIVAVKGEPVQVSAYPWMNDKTEDELKRIFGDSDKQ